MAIRNRAFLIATLSDRFGDLSGVVIQGLIVLVLALFFLIESEMLAPKLVRFFAPAPGDAHSAERALNDLVHQVRAYLIARTLINIGLGAVFAIALALFGVRYAAAQGGLIALTNYVPYVGQVFGGVVAMFAALLQGKEFGDALIVVAIYVGLLGIEGYIVTPYVLGRSLDLNGTTVLIACLFWGFLWGLVGLVLAMPLAVCMKLVFQHVPSLHRWADLMSQTWVPPTPALSKNAALAIEIEPIEVPPPTAATHDFATGPVRAEEAAQRHREDLNPMRLATMRTRRPGTAERPPWT